METLMRARCLSRADARLAGQNDVLLLVDAMLDVSVRYSLTKAAETASIRLFDRVLKRVQSDGTDRFLVRRWLASAMEIAIKKKDLAMIQRIHAVHPQPLAIKSLQLAVDYANLEIVQWLAANRYDGLCLTCPPLQCGGDVRLLDCCLERRGPCPPLTRERSGIRRWLCDQGFSKGTAVDGREAVENGDIETVRWIVNQQGIDMFSELSYRSAPQRGHFQLAAVLCEAGLRLGWQVAPIAILVPRDVARLYSTELQLLKENKVVEVTRKEFPRHIQSWCRKHWKFVTTDDESLLQAIRDGELEAAKWIRETHDCSSGLRGIPTRQSTVIWMFSSGCMVRSVALVTTISMRRLPRTDIFSSLNG